MTSIRTLSVSSIWPRLVMIGLAAALAVLVVSRPGFAGSTATFQGCENTATGVVRLLTAPDGTALNLAPPYNQCLDANNAAAAQLLRAFPKLAEVPITWNQQGPPGATGPTGPTGADGAPGPKGDKGDPGTFTGVFTSPNGQYSISVTDTGITLAGPGGQSLSLQPAASPNSGTQLVIHTTTVNVTSDADTSLRVGGDYRMDASSNGTIKAGGSLDIESSGNNTVKGSTISLNGGCNGVASQGSPVVTDPGSGVGSVTLGSPTVLTC